MIMWNKKIIWWLLLVHMFNEILGFIPLSSSINSGNFHKHQQLGQLIKMCFSHRSNPLVLTENLIDIIDQNSRESMQCPINVINNEFQATNIQIFNPARPTYFLATDSDDKLNKILKEFESMATWSIQSLFFIVDLTNDNFCKNALQVLQILWKRELLSSFYVCNKPLSNTILIFTLNPYGPHAVQPWIKVKTDDQSDTRQTLFYQSYTNDEKICQNLTFDKTKILDGYPLKVVGSPYNKTKRTQNELCDKRIVNEYYTGCDKEIFKNESTSFRSKFYLTLFSAMNVTPMVYCDCEGYFENGEIYGFLKSLVNGSLDISMNFRRIFTVPSELIDTIQLYTENGYLILTQRRNLKIPLEEVNEYYTIDVVILLIFTLMITFVTILFASKRLSDPILDIFQLILGGGIMTSMKYLSVRFVFLISIVVLFIVRPALEGTLSALMSGSESYRVENLKDLHNLKYNVYVHIIEKNFVESEKLWIGSEKKFLRYTNESDNDCYDWVLNNSKTACIAYSTVLLPYAIKYKSKLHLSESRIFKTYFTYWARRNWALKNRVNQITMRLTEFGIIDYWNWKVYKNPMKNLKDVENIEKSSKLFQIDFENLHFGYFFMIIMITLSLMVLSIEIYCGRKIWYRYSQRKKLCLK